MSVRHRFDVHGVVHGVGFRAFALTVAHDTGVTGKVWTTASGAVVEAQGDEANVDNAQRAIAHAPQPIVVRDIEVTPMPPVRGEQAMRAWPTEGGAASPSLGADRAVCDACLVELADPGDRRHRDPFLHCAVCGPRWALVTETPWGRERTTLADFVPCPACTAERVDGRTRRTRLDTITCPDCGPVLHLGGSDGEVALAAAVGLLRGGGLAAVKGQGGFQILCDAANDAAVRRLRAGTRRLAEPLPVMVPRRFQVGGLSGAERELLDGPDAPIVPVRTRIDVAPSVRGGLTRIGLMRPSTPVHHMLLDALALPVVCTSASRGDAPPCIDATQVLGLGIVDTVLDLGIALVRPVEDSVVRARPGERRLWRRPERIFVRRGRGHVPLPIPILGDGPPVLGVGARRDAAGCLLVGDLAVLSPRVGTLSSPAALDAFHMALTDLARLHGVTPSLLATDLDEDLPSSRWADMQAGVWGARVVRVQRHEALIATVIAERKLARRAVGLVWSAPARGHDRGLWGGEALLVDGTSFTRVGSLRPFPLPDPGAAARYPAHTAVALLHALGESPSRSLAARIGEVIDPAPVQEACTAPATSACTSVERLLDAIGFLVGLPGASGWPGHHRAVLEDLAERAGPVDPFPLPMEEVDGVLTLDWRPMLAEVLLGDRPRTVLAARVHATLGLGAQLLAHHARVQDVVLAGECFTDAKLVATTLEHLERLGLTVHVPDAVPMNDSGLALGQAWLARARAG